MYYRGYDIRREYDHVVAYKDGEEEFADDTFDSACKEIDSIEIERCKGS